jgi:hypothetical protein
MKGVAYLLLLIIVGCSAPQNIEELQLLQEFEKIESYRVWTTKKGFNDRDSMYLKERCFIAFDSLNRIINKNDHTFYYYDANDRIIERKSIYRREDRVKILTDVYHYDSIGNLIVIIANEPPADTVRKFQYNEYNQVIRGGSRYYHTTYEYEYRADQLIKKVVKDNYYIRRSSEYVYDSIGRIATEHWFFGDDHRMKTTFEYDDKSRLIVEIDSSCTNHDSPNTYIEFKTVYQYNSKDSIIEITDYGRILSENEFRFSGRTTFEYQ